MGALVVYESWFGNGAAVARAVADGLGDAVAVELRAVADAPDEIGDDVELLVVGAPNHRFGLSRPSSRRDAGERGAVPSTATAGMREWADRVRVPLGTPVAVWDTRLERPAALGVVDHAAETLRRRLRRRGARPVAVAHFRVVAMEGPLVDGEVDRARRWAAELARSLRGRGARPT
jgi:hypothetical protein